LVLGDHVLETLAALCGRPTEELTQSIVSATVTMDLLDRSRRNAVPEHAKPRRTELLNRSGIHSIDRIERW
jgi:hypothetical protein